MRILKMICTAALFFFLFTTVRAEALIYTTNFTGPHWSSAGGASIEVLSGKLASNVPLSSFWDSCSPRAIGVNAICGLNGPFVQLGLSSVSSSVEYLAPSLGCCAPAIWDHWSGSFSLEGTSWSDYQVVVTGTLRFSDDDIDSLSTGDVLGIRFATFANAFARPKYEYSTFSVLDSNGNFTNVEVLAQTYLVGDVSVVDGSFRQIPYTTPYLISHLVEGSGTAFEAIDSTDILPPFGTDHPITNAFGLFEQRLTIRLRSTAIPIPATSALILLGVIALPFGSRSFFKYSSKKRIR